MAHILLLEDDSILAKSLCFNIERSGNDVVWADSVQDFHRRLGEKSFDLFLLDVQLPDGNGIDLCQELRKQSVTAPIMMITAQDSEDMIVAGLMRGADDYVNKPFSMRELLARIHVQLKGAERAQNKRIVEYNGLRVDLQQRRVFYFEREIQMKPTKLDILYFLVGNAEKVVSRDTFLRFLQKENEIFDRTIDAHISQLRNILKSEGVEELRITSIYGTGYKLDSQKPGASN